MKKYTLIGLFILFSNVAIAGDNLEEAANDVCQCLGEPYKTIEKIVEDLKKAQASGDTTKLMQYQGEVMGAIQATTPCFENLAKKYPGINQDKKLQKQVMDMADKQCPNPAAELFGNTKR